MICSFPTAPPPDERQLSVAPPSRRLNVGLAERGPLERAFAQARRVAAETAALQGSP
ncbi:MAG TPA: hypothetical protein VH599_12500 [Ktedonobacterales bacterium]